MKQIKVYITAEQWAEKRLQLAGKFKPENIDRVIEQCGFKLIEETKPDFKRCGEEDNLCKCKSEKECGYSPEIPTDKVEAVKYFLNQLPSGYKERALAQVDERRVKKVGGEIKNIVEALYFFCEWADTNEGEMFWREVAQHYFRPATTPMLPSLPND